MFEVLFTDDKCRALQLSVVNDSGQGVASPFRRRVFTHLAAEADRFHTVMIMDTHTAKLAQLYIHAMPGLGIVAQRRTINEPNAQPRTINEPNL